MFKMLRKLFLWDGVFTIKTIDEPTETEQIYAPGSNPPPPSAKTPYRNPPPPSRHHYTSSVAKRVTKKIAK